MKLKKLKQGYSRWWRAYGSSIDDPKLAKLTDKAHRVWWEILCLQCLDGDENGVTGMTISQYLWRSRRSDVHIEIKSLCAESLIKVGRNGIISIPRWGERQHVSDNKSTSERVAKHRYMKRRCNNDVTLHVTSDVTKCNATEQNRTEQNIYCAAGSDDPDSAATNDYSTWARAEATKWHDSLAADSFPNVESVGEQITRALDWLAVQPKSRRKKNIGKFLRNWMDSENAKKGFSKQKNIPVVAGIEDVNDPRILEMGWEAIEK